MDDGKHQWPRPPRTPVHQNAQRAAEPQDRPQAHRPTAEASETGHRWPERPGLPGTPVRDFNERSKPLPRTQQPPLSSAFLDAVYVGPRCSSPRLGGRTGSSPPSGGPVGTCPTAAGSDWGCEGGRPCVPSRASGKASWRRCPWEESEETRWPGRVAQNPLQGAVRGYRSPHPTPSFQK